MTDKESIEKEWDKFEDAFYQTATREQLIENLKQVSAYNRHLLNVSGAILSWKLSVEQELSALKAVEGRKKE